MNDGVTNDGVTGIHHINFLVHDLDQAEQRYRDLLGLGPALRDELAGRQVRTARFKLGDTWLVLVQPLSDEGEPARHLREHGEGFFLISFATEDLDAAISRVQAQGYEFTSDAPRRGLDNWRVIDLEPGSTLGATLQLMEEPDGSGS